MRTCRRSSRTVLLGSPVVPFCPFSFWVPLLKPSSRKKGTLIIKKGTLIIKGLLGNLGCERWSLGVGAYRVRGAQSGSPCSKKRGL